MRKALPKWVGAVPLIVAAPKVGDVAEHGPPGQIALARSVSQELAGHVQVDLVLQDLLDHDGHVVATAHVHERPGPLIQGDHPLLNQGGELETPAHLVDDCFFLQIIEHFNFFRPDQYQKTGYWRNRVLSNIKLWSVFVFAPSVLSTNTKCCRSPR